MAPGRESSAEASYDPMRQFAELAGDVRDPYPMFAELRAGRPVMQVHQGTQPGRHQLDGKAPKMPPLFTVTSHEYAEQVLTDNARFSSAGYAMTIGQVMGRTIVQMDPPGDASAAERGARPPAAVAAGSRRRGPAHPRADIPLPPEPARPFRSGPMRGARQ